MGNVMPLKIALLSFPSPFLQSSFGDLQKEIRQTQKEEREKVGVLMASRLS